MPTTYATKRDLIKQELDPIIAQDDAPRITAETLFDHLADQNLIVWHTALDHDGSQLVTDCGFRLVASPDQFWAAYETLDTANRA